MIPHNLLALDRLSLFCHFGGLFTVFIGLVLTMFNLINGDFTDIQVGIYIFAMGYALFKVGARLAQIVTEEKAKSNLL